MAFIVILMTFLPFEAIKAQSGADEADPRVQKLYAEAREAEARGDAAGAVEKYESIIQIEPRLGPAYNNLGALYLRMGEFPRAVEILKKGLSIDPAMPSASALLGISFYEMREYADARRPLETALRSNPKDDNAELVLAKDLIKLGDCNAAETHLALLAHREPKNQEIWYLLGQVYTTLATDSYEKVDAINPNSVLSHEIRGDVMASMNNYPGALLEYKKAVELGPKEPGTHYKLADAYWKLEEWGSAQKEFDAELTNDPTNCEAQWKLGNILLQQHLDPQQALQDINKAVALCPSVTDARVDRARALLLLNRPADALQDLNAAEKADPDEPSIHFLLSQAYRGVGRTKEAQAEMQVFAKLEQSAHSAEANRAQQVLQLKNGGKQNPPN
jgi:tetratricopeptide (TPR) repeat protein